ncbi:hypothetical protein EDD21DRAFT_375911, partial [Dissophora ornata]
EFDKNRYGQVRDQDRQGDGAERSMLSICQVAAKFVREMADTMQKWRLATSIHRRPVVPLTIFASDTNEPSAPTQTDEDASSSMQDHATHNGRTQGHAPAGVGPGHSQDYDVLPPPRRTAMEPTAAPNGLPVVAGPHGVYYTMAGPGYVNHVAGETNPAGQPQTPFAFPMQFWQPDAEYSREYGSADQLLGETFPAIAASDIGAMFDTPFMDYFFD